MLDKINRTVPDEWTGRVYGVRIEYPVSDYISISAHCADKRSTQENYDTCLAEMEDFLGETWVRGDEEAIRISFYTSQ